MQSPGAHVSVANVKKVPIRLIGICALSSVTNSY